MSKPNTTPMTRHVLRVYRAATPEQHAAGLAWYDDAASVSYALAVANGHSVATAAGVIAATSPVNSWGSNVNLAARILASGDTSSGYLSSGLAKARAILDGARPLDVLSGEKVRNFYLCIALAGRHPDAVCVDRHAYDLAVNHRHTDATRPGLTPKRYALVAEVYRRAAVVASRESGRVVTPAQVQAVTWLAWRSRFWATGAYDQHNHQPAADDAPTTGRRMTCAQFRAMDTLYSTSPDSPLHHDNRCTAHGTDAR